MREPTPCNDCKVDVQEINEWYMLKFEVWPLGNEDVYPYNVDTGFLCVGCCEARLGRTLERKDFLMCWGNFTWNFSERLKNRFGTQDIMSDEEKEEMRKLYA